MEEALSVLCSRLGTATALSVEVGQPKSVGAQIVLWPWRMGSARAPDNAPPHPHETRRERRQMALWFLVLSTSGLDHLVRVARWLADNPILVVGVAHFRVSEQDVTPEALVAMFSAAGIPLRPAMSCVIEG